MAAPAPIIPQIAFSRNPIPVIINGADYLAVAGVAAIFQMVFNDAVASGQQIPMVWAAANITLACVDEPDNSGLQFPPGDGGTDYVNSLINLFNTNYYIARDFTLAYGEAEGISFIIFTANALGALYNVSPISGDVVSITTDVLGVNQEYQANFANMLQVWIQIAGTFTKVYEQNLQMDLPYTGITTKDIADILNPYLDPQTNSSDRPDVAAIGWQPCLNSLLQYFIVYGEYYGESPTVKQVTKSPMGFVNLGGLDVNSALGQTLQGYLQPNSINSKTMCLRQGSKLKMIQTDQPEWLYWINLTGADIDVKVRVKLFYTDGGSGIFYYTALTASAWQKYYVPVGYKAININANLPSGKSCAYYVCTVLSAAGATLSLDYTYVIDIYRQFPRYFVYLNSLGGYQTLYTWGKAQAETDRTKEDVVRQVTYPQAAVSGRFLENNIRIQRKCTVNTGYSTKRDITLLNDFLVSTEKYIFYEGRLIPIGLTTDNQKEAKDGDTLNASVFEFYPLYDEVVFTDDVTLEDDPNSAPGGAGAAGGFNFIIDDDNNLDDLYYDDL